MKSMRITQNAKHSALLCPILQKQALYTYSNAVWMLLHRSGRSLYPAENGQKYTDLLVIGIGGSYLGARAVVELLGSPNYNLKKKDTPNIYFAGNGLSSDQRITILNDSFSVRYTAPAKSLVSLIWQE